MKMIIVGCGRNGSGLAQALSKMGHDVTVIDSNGAAFKELGPSFRGETIEGIGFDRDVLQKARIERTDALAAFTSSDESNAVIARITREIYHVPKVVARLYDREKAEIYRRLGVQTLSSTTWGIKRAVDLLCYSPLNTVFSMGNGDVELMEIEATPLMEGHRVSEFTVSGEVSIVSISRGNKTILPTLGTVLQKGDILYAAAAVSAGSRLKRIFGLSNGKGM
ncbi:TrkA family potassium uptake protein [Lachnospiraceae bacterium 54-53]